MENVAFPNHWLLIRIQVSSVGYFIMKYKSTDHPEKMWQTIVIALVVHQN